MNLEVPYRSSEHIFIFDHVVEAVHVCIGTEMNGRPRISLETKS